MNMNNGRKRFYWERCFLKKQVAAGNKWPNKNKGLLWQNAHSHAAHRSAIKCFMTDTGTNRKIGAFLLVLVVIQRHTGAGHSSPGTERDHEEDWEGSNGAGDGRMRQWGRRTGQMGPGSAAPAHTILNPHMYQHGPATDIARVVLGWPIVAAGG